MSIEKRIAIFQTTMKRMLAAKYLDWAEVLPPFQGGIIHTLQRQRSNQRTQSARLYAESRPPDGATIEFQGLRFVMPFSIEKFDELEKGLYRLFSRSPKIADRIEELSS